MEATAPTEPATHYGLDLPTHPNTAMLPDQGPPSAGSAPAPTGAPPTSVPPGVPPTSVPPPSASTSVPPPSALEQLSPSPHIFPVEAARHEAKPSTGDALLDSSLDTLEGIEDLTWLIAADKDLEKELRKLEWLCPADKP
eukprot:gene21296-28228_t